MKKSALFILSLFILLPGTSVLAQNENRSVLETLTVTAQKQEENIQDVPISMNVLTDVDVEDAGIVKLSELTRYVPNLFTTPALDNCSIVIRGISTMNVALNPVVGVFVNDIAYPMNRMQNPDLIDIERIEVLRGPQGTLYGKNTESGVINIITRQPDNEFRGKILGEYGFFDAEHKNVPFYRIGATINTPLITDTLFLGGSFQFKGSDGYVTNIYKHDDQTAETDHKNGQINLRWTPSSAWDISFIADMSKHDDGFGYWRYADGAAQTGRHVINWDDGNNWVEKNNNQVLRIKYDGSAFDLLSITSRSDYRTDITNDAELGPMPMQNQDFVYDILSYSQEIRLSSPKTEKKLNWVAGVFASRDETYAKSHTPAFFMARDTDIDSRSLAVFGQATYTFFDRLHLSAGARFEHQKLEGSQLNAMPTPRSYSRTVSNNEFLPKLSISYDLTDSIMAYASYAKGFLSGGYDFHMANSVDELYFEPEHTSSYETGLKTSFWDQKLILNAAVFHIDIKDKQVVEWPVGQPPSIRRITNAAQASSDGFELEMTVRPVSGWDIFAGFGYTKARFDSWTAPLATGGVFDYKGKYLPNAPKYTFHLGSQYRTESGFFLRADLLGTGPYYYDSENSQKLDGYETVNLKIGYEWENLDLVLWADNVFDKEYLTSKLPYMGLLVEDGAPRSIGMTMTWRF